MIYTLRNLNKVLKQTKLYQVYLVLVESLISYGTIDQSGAFDNAISQLQVCQNQILRMLLNKK